MKPSIPDVLLRFVAYQQKPGNGAWGPLHVVLSDGNVEDSVVRGCIERAHEQGDVDGEELAKVLLSMSRTQRSKISRAVWAARRASLSASSNP